MYARRVGSRWGEEDRDERAKRRERREAARGGEEEEEEEEAEAEVAVKAEEAEELELEAEPEVRVKLEAKREAELVLPSTVMTSAGADEAQHRQGVVKLEAAPSAAVHTKPPAPQPPVEALPPGQPYPLGTAVEVMQHASEFCDERFAWKAEHGSSKPFHGVRLGGIKVRNMDKQLRWYSATITGGYDPLSGRYAEVTFDDGDEDGTRDVLARFVRTAD